MSRRRIFTGAAYVSLVAIALVIATLATGKTSVVGLIALNVLTFPSSIACYVAVYILWVVLSPYIGSGLLVIAFQIYLLAAVFQAALACSLCELISRRRRAGPGRPRGRRSRRPQRRLGRAASAAP